MDVCSQYPQVPLGMFTVAGLESKFDQQCQSVCGNRWVVKVDVSLQYT